MNCLRAYLVLANAIDISFRGTDASFLRRKRIDASGLSSQERMRIEASVRDSSFFSAKVSDAKLLERMRGYIADAESGKRGMSRNGFISAMRRELGVTEGESQRSRGALTDISSSRRLGLIYDFQKQRLDAEIDAARGNDPIHADNFPALELIREESRRVPRNWRERWFAAGGKFYGGRMIALRDDPIWMEISRFGSPLPPFDYNSGMGTREVSKFELEALGFPSGNLVSRDGGTAQEAARFRHEGSERLPKEFLEKLPDTDEIRKARERVAEVPLRPVIENRSDAESYTRKLLGKDRRVDLSEFGDTEARTIALSVEKAKYTGILDSAGVTGISSAPKNPRAYGEVEKKTGKITLFKNAETKNEGRTTPIHEIVHLFNDEIERDPKLRDELMSLHNGYRRAINLKANRHSLPPLSDNAEISKYEFLSDAVAYYLNGGKVLGFGKRAFVFLQKVIKLRGR